MLDITGCSDEGEPALNPMSKALHSIWIHAFYLNPGHVSRDYDLLVFSFSVAFGEGPNPLKLKHVPVGSPSNLQSSRSKTRNLWLPPV